MSKFQQMGLNLGLLALRVLMGLGIAYHGYEKIFVNGVDKFVPFVVKMGLPAPELMAWAAALGEFGGGILIALGLGTRFAAIVVFINMSVAAFIAHKADPLKVKELALAYWTIAGALVLTGGGAFSMDNLICSFKDKKDKDKKDKK